MAATPGWLHFISMVEGLKERFEREMLAGKLDHIEYRAYQASYGILLSILAIPEQVQQGETAVDELMQAYGEREQVMKSAAKQRDNEGFYFDMTPEDEKKVASIAALFDNEEAPLDKSLPGA